jgi:hypothetical protein
VCVCADGSIGGVWIGLPCKTWSVARMRDPIRNHSWGVWGLDEVSSGDRDRLREGNKQARWAARLFEKLAKQKCPVAIENPASSLVWFTPVYVRLRRLFTCVDFDMCAFGTEYRKRTRILCANWQLDSLRDKRCAGRGGHCTFSGAPHVELVGGAKTKPAGVYPRALCRFLLDRLERSC